MINIFKISLSAVRKALEAAHGLGIENDSLQIARKS
jgi:hypothetical protein